jgi:ABC-type cobalamin/Fe3+-siderophores transport system ATPase subunit
LHRLNQSGITIMAAVHDLHSARRHFSSAVLLRPDSSLTFGPPELVLTPKAIQEVFGLHSTANECSTTVSDGSLRNALRCI